MTVIQKDDFINSIASAFQFISYYHPKDFVDAVYEAWKKEKKENSENNKKESKEDKKKEVKKIDTSRFRY